MGISPLGSGNPYDYGNPAVTVDHLIGTSYTTVRLVAQNIEFVKHVSAHLRQIFDVSGNVEHIDAVYAHLDTIDSVAGNITQVASVASNISALLLISTQMVKLLEIYENLEDMILVNDNIEDLLVLISKMNIVENVNTNMTLLTELHAELGNIVEVQASLGAINTINSSIGDIITVNSNITIIQALYDNLTALLAVRTNLTAINAVDAQLPLIVSVGNNIASITAVNAAAATITSVNNNLTAINAVNTKLTLITDVGNNIAAITAVNNNIAVINTVNTNLPAIVAINTNLAVYQRIDNNLTKLVDIDNNMPALLALYAKLNELLALSSMNIGNVPNGIPQLNSSGKLVAGIIPDDVYGDVFTVASQAAMLGLTAYRGAIAIRTDVNKSFMLSGNTPATLANWKEVLASTVAPVTSVIGLTGAITQAAFKAALLTVTADIGDMSANGRSLVTAANYAAMASLLGLVKGTASGNIPVLDSGGKLDVSILPSLALTEVFVVASQAAMLALTAQIGDVAIRSDLSKSFVLSTNSPTTLADWKELLTPTNSVLSVAGLTGAVPVVGLRNALFSQTIVTANTAVTAGQTVIFNTAGGALTATLDAAPTNGDILYIGRIGANNVTINVNGQAFNGFAGNFVLDTNNIGVSLLYVGSKWFISPWSIK